MKKLAIRDWPLMAGASAAAPVRQRGMVVLVHGLGEHIGRYEKLAHRLNAWGFAVRGYDHYGHGVSDGVRGGLPSDLHLVEDLARVVEGARKDLAAGQPLILLGHSMGGAVVAHALALERVAVDGLVLSSPALDPGLGAAQKVLLAVLPKIAPDLRVSNGLDSTKLSHDTGVVRAYQQDPLVHDRISARLARYISDAGRAVIDKAPGWSTPTLLLYAGRDKLVSPRGSAEFAQAASEQVVESHVYPELYHEIFLEHDSEPVFRHLGDWLTRKFP